MSAITSSEQPRKGLPFYVAFAPWVAFTVLAAHSSMKVGSIAALALAVAIAIPGIASRKPKLLELGAVVTFAAFVAIAFKADASVAHWVTKYARAIAAGGLSVISLASLLFVPFTEQYARESVPERFWNSPQFHAANRRLTAMWSGIFAAMIPFHIIAASIDTTRGNLIFNWGVPAALVMFGLKRSTAEKTDTSAAA
jgi:hypothetical protein